MVSLGARTVIVKLWSRRGRCGLCGCVLDAAKVECLVTLMERISLHTYSWAFIAVVLGPRATFGTALRVVIPLFPEDSPVVPFVRLAIGIGVGGLPARDEDHACQDQYRESEKYHLRAFAHSFSSLLVVKIGAA